MTKPTTARWTALSLWLGDGGTPETFTDITCGITSRTFGMTADHRESAMPPAADVRSPAWIRRVVANHLATFSGSGVFAEEVWPTFRDWYLSGQPRNARIRLETINGGYFYAAWLLTELGLPAQLDNGLVHSNVTLVSTKRLQWIYDVPSSEAGNTTFYMFGTNYTLFNGGLTQPGQLAITGTAAAVQFTGRRILAGQLSIVGNSLSSLVGAGVMPGLHIVAASAAQFVGHKIISGQLQIIDATAAAFTGTVVQPTFTISGNTAVVFVSPAEWIDDINESAWIDDIGETVWIDD